MRDHLREDAAAPTGSATTMSSISYLPTEVGKVRSALKGLRKHKTKWDLEVRENDESYTVQFEDKLTVEVPKEHWESFQGLFEGTLDNDAYFDLQVKLQDRVQLSEDQVIEFRKDEFRGMVEEAFRCREIQVAEKVAEHWACIMGCNQILTESMQAFIPLQNIDEFIENYITDVLKENQDLGSLEIAIESFCFERLVQLYEGKQCLAGARFQAVYEGTEAIFEARVSWDRDCSFSISVGDPEVADALEEAYVGLPRVGNVLYPRLGQILGSEGIFESLKEVISDKVDEGEESEDETI
jgi:hypothetical protein